jgi:hypothetical protein
MIPPSPLTPQHTRKHIGKVWVLVGLLAVAKHDTKNNDGRLFLQVVQNKWQILRENKKEG